VVSTSGSKRLIARSLRRVTRTAVPRRRRPQLRALVNRATAPLYRGDRVECPVCERRFDRFRSYTSVNRNRYLVCPSCGSFGRHRLDWLFLRERTNLFHAPIRLLHVAPELSLGARFEALENVEYVSADYDSALASEQMDIRDIKYPDATFDAIVCNHVLEHVDNDRLALSELFRVLKPGGWALLQVPIGRPGQATYDDPTITSDRERERLFGQFDHVRIYGSDYPARLAEAGFDVEVIAYADEFGADEVRRMGLDRGELIHWARRP
jgi:SAM-dependent methyltransferase